jgi:hypothetical protein
MSCIWRKTTTRPCSHNLSLPTSPPPPSFIRSSLLIIITYRSVLHRQWVQCSVYISSFELVVEDISSQNTHPSQSFRDLCVLYVLFLVLVLVTGLPLSPPYLDLDLVHQPSALHHPYPVLLLFVFPAPFFRRSALLYFRSNASCISRAFKQSIKHDNVV